MKVSPIQQYSFTYTGYTRVGNRQHTNRVETNTKMLPTYIQPEKTTNELLKTVDLNANKAEDEETGQKYVPSSKIQRN